MVGVAGLEPATSWSQTMRASQLRYTPKTNFQLSIPAFAACLRRSEAPASRRQEAATRPSSEVEALFLRRTGRQVKF